MLVTLAGMWIFVQPVPENAHQPIVVTVSGILISVSFEQCAKAAVGMAVSFLESVRDVRFSHPANAAAPIPVTLSSMTIFSILSRWLYHGTSEIKS